MSFLYGRNLFYCLILLEEKPKIYKYPSGSMRGVFHMSDTFDDVKATIVEVLSIEASKVTLEAKFREDLEADSST
jgi:hypothetical protein